ncbi:SWIM zinc finger family protein [Haloarcula amylovorans]|uniref:SWIM zinc finger family protein n=1 Tax=Haloarcula amylovorans TaxID=2562280 RepID=UPI001076486C|nr:SWIM zinc finger family protein [Halomicroarcula amylolytica]
MTLLKPSANAEPTALAPDPSSLSSRAVRAWTERMAVRQQRDGTYAVATESGHTYVVDLRDHSCTCPDHEIRGERCKHLRRVAIEITARRIAPPGRQRARCDVCEEVTFVPEEAEPPHLCGNCRVAPGDIVVDRETGDSLVVAEVMNERANEYVIEATGKTVAAHDTNDGYPKDDIVVEVTYLGDATRNDNPRRYAFPYSRLNHTDAELVG